MLLRNAVETAGLRDQRGGVGRAAENVTRKVIALLEQIRERREPFFLFVNYMDAHIPRVPPPPFDTLFAREQRSAGSGSTRWRRSRPLRK